MPGFNDLWTTHPKLAAEIVDGDPTAVSAGSQKRFLWKCDSGHRWEAPVSGRARGEGCPVCAGRVVAVGHNDLATTHPDLAKQASGWDPATVTAGSNKKVPWRCERGHEWEAMVNARSRGSGCPYCIGQKVLVGVNDLKTTHPALAAEACGWDPTTVIAGTGKNLTWRCRYGHEWVTRGADRVAGKGCPVCSGQRVLPGHNDIQTTHPDLAAQAHGWDPTTVRAGGSVKYGWKCDRGHQWEATIGSRKVGSGCPICSNRKVLAGFNDLGTTHPDLAAEALGWDASTITAGNDTKKLWRCEFGHEWEAIVYNRAKGIGCPVCAGQKVLQGFNDLATTNPGLVREIIEGDARSVTSGSGQVFRWRCEAGHQWSARVAERVQGRGCPACAKYGFRPSERAWLYLLRQPEWGLLKIGITNVPEIRMQQHGRKEWTLVELVGPMDGVLAKSWESDILRLLRVKQAEFIRAEVHGKFSGYTEAWREASYPVRNVRELMDCVRDAEAVQFLSTPDSLVRGRSGLDVKRDGEQSAPSNVIGANGLPGKRIVGTVGRATHP